VALGFSAGALQARAFARWARFSQQRARIDATRENEALASTQRAPADDQGISLEWSRGGFLAGGDLRRVFGRSIEQPASGAIAETTASGEQRMGGVFARQLFEPLAWLRVQAALRADFWSNEGYARRQVPVSGPAVESDLADRSDVSLSPRLAARAEVAPWLSVRAAGYRSFRAPTLNELYRPFQVGPVRTEANPELGPETLLGAEAGFDLPWLRATAFYAQLRDPIVNVTVAPNSQMRQNLGAARIRGLELSGLWVPLGGLRLSLAWTFTDARLSSGNLAGNQLPQDPRHRVVAAASFADPRIVEVHVEVRWTSEQFEDDANHLVLPGFAVLNLQLVRTLTRGWDVFVAAENLLDRKYLVGLQGGIAMVGQPLFLRAGVRARLF
jgi:outer membrane receptor protein involved in Fe transport